MRDTALTTIDPIGRLAMARITLIPESELEPSMQRYQGQMADGVVRGLGGHRPELAERWFALYLPLGRDDGALPIELKELVRLQIAAYYGCEYCQALVSPLAQQRDFDRDKLPFVLTPDDSQAPLTDRERAMLGFTLKMATGKGELSEADFDAVRRYFDEPQLVELGFLAAMLIGYGRFTITGFELVE
jgi:alkylhydroperoxidase family enzyme